MAKDALHNYKLDGENKIKVCFMQNTLYIWPLLTCIHLFTDHVCQEVRRVVILFFLSFVVASYIIRQASSLTRSYHFHSRVGYQHVDPWSILGSVSCSDGSFSSLAVHCFLLAVTQPRPIVLRSDCAATGHLFYLLFVVTHFQIPESSSVSGLLFFGYDQP